MRMRKDSALLSLLLGGGVYLLEMLKDRLGDPDELADRARSRFNDLKDKAADAYGTATDRASRAADVIRGDDNQFFGKTAALLVGVGVGVGVGMLLAPASGEVTRSKIKEKVSDGFSREKEHATGTY
jgi:ElaB/YqjD/DUF883 family membrane-anchored ribosome-binding protein